MCSSFQGTYSLMWQRDDLIVWKCVTVGSAVKMYREVAAHGQCDHHTGHCGHVLTVQGQVRHWLQSPERSLPVLPFRCGPGTVCGAWHTDCACGCLSHFPGADECQPNPCLFMGLREYVTWIPGALASPLERWGVLFSFHSRSPQVIPARGNNLASCLHPSVDLACLRIRDD